MTEQAPPSWEPPEQAAGPGPGLVFAPHGPRLVSYLIDGPKRFNELRREIPAVLTSGDHAKVAAWRRNQAEELTKARRPDLYAASRNAPPAQGTRAKPRD